MRSTNAILSLVFALCVLCAVASDCSRHCYSGVLDFASNDGEPTSTEFSFGVVPCSQTVDGHIDQVPFTAFSCDATDGLLRVTVHTASGDLPFYQLQWIYNTSDTCESALANGLEFSDSSSAFSGTAHVSLRMGSDLEPTSVTATGGSLSSLEAVCGQDCGQRCFSVRMLANYVPQGDETGVGEGSPCGVAGTQQCVVTLSFTVQPCTGYLSALEVLVGVDGTPLSLYDPAQLANARLVCQENGQLQLDATGFYVLWDVTAQPCSVLLDSLNTAAIGGVTQLAVIVGHDTWTSDVAQGAQTSLSLSVCQSVGSGNVTDDDDVFTDAVHVLKRILPFVNCSHQIEFDQCCTVFGYLNPNAQNVNLPRVQGSNWFTPTPVNQGQITTFFADTRNPSAFSVIWPCNKYERHVLTWSLKHPVTGQERFWFRQARAVRTRNDCSAAIRDDWCVQLS